MQHLSGYFLQLKDVRANTIKERLDGIKESASFEIATLFTSLHRDEISGAISKLRIFWLCRVVLLLS